MQGEEGGAMFTLDHGGRQYLISAKHVLPDLSKIGEIEVRKNGDWEQIAVNYVGETDENLDVIVFSAEKILSAPDLKLPMNMEVAIGQDVFFAGFPMGMHGDFVEINNGYPIPFIKKGNISMFGPSIDFLYIDALINKGFSGGPVIHHGYRNNYYEPQVCGVITHSKTLRHPVFHNNVDHGHTVAIDTGIFVAASIKHVRNIIETNPIGIPIA